MPMFGGLAARVGTTSYRSMTSDPGEWTSCLAKTAALFEPDAIVVGFDPTLSIEALGAPLHWENDEPRIAPLDATPAASVPACSRLGAAIETAARVFPEAAQRTGCVAAMAGSLLLATQAFGAERAAAALSELRSFQVAVVEALCRTRPHMLLFIESRPARIGTAERRAYNTLRNVASHYNAATAVYVEGYPPSLLADLPQLGLDFYLIGPDADGRVPGMEETGCLREATGAGLALLDEPAAAAAVTTSRFDCGQPNLLLTTRGALSADADVRELLDAMAVLKKIGRGEETEP